MTLCDVGRWEASAGMTTAGKGKVRMGTKLRNGSEQEMNNIVKRLTGRTLCLTRPDRAGPRTAGKLTSDIVLSL